MKRITLIVASVLTLMPLIGALGAVRVIEDTPAALVLTVQPEEWSMEEISGVMVPVPRGSGLDKREGARVVPCYRRLIAIPTNQSPAISIIQQSWGKLSPGTLPEGSEEITDIRAPEPGSSQPFELGKPFRWRGRWVVDLWIYPLQVVNGGTRQLEKLTVRLVYSGTGGRGLVRRDVLAEKTLLNPIAASRWANTSPVALSRRAQSWPDGELIRIELETEGIYEISRETLEQNGIDFSGYDPRSFRLFGNGGGVLDEDPAAPRDSALRENAILVEGEQDGSWDYGDKIVFYGRSVNSWIPYQPPGEYRHTNNPFTRRNVYWLNVSGSEISGRRMEQIGTEKPVTYTPTVARSRMFIENDLFIFHNEHTPESGKKWYASDLYAGDRYTATFNIEQIDSERSAKVWVSNSKVPSGGTGVVNIELNGVPVDTFTLSVGVHSIDVQPGLLHSGSNTFSFYLLSGHGLFDWFEVNYFRFLETSTGRISFDAFPEDGVADVSITGLTDPWIFDIQDFDNVKYIRSDTFAAETMVTMPRRYIGLSDGEFYTPLQMERDEPGGMEYPVGLRDPSLGADYIIIVHEDFWDVTATLESYIEERDGIEVMRVLLPDIYNEFSWGVTDPTAIRDFLMYALENWSGGGSVPYACLLAGDGDYDYRNILSNNDRNWIPPYENNGESRDDWYVDFSDSDDPSYIISRLPFQTEREIESFTSRLQVYQSKSDAEHSVWRSRVVLVGDDEYVETGPQSIDKWHIKHSDSLDVNGYVPAWAQTRKIYLGTYPTEYSPSTGERLKPLATQELIGAINQGVLLINYMGHGNAHVWAHETVLSDNRDLGIINSGSREPVIVAATCAWGYFDRPDNEAFFEQLMGREGGSLAVIAATRNTSGHSNFTFIKKLYEYFFDREAAMSIGECLYRAKIEAPGATNHYYHCFGEAMMIPAVPKLDMTVTEITPDSLVALEIGQVDGLVMDFQNMGTGAGASAPVMDFNGEAQVTVFNSFDSLTYVFYDETEFKYRVPGSILFRGLVSVTNGEYVSRFMVPRDINYGSSDSWIQMFASDGESNAVGSRQGVKISSEFADNIDDTDPPDISIYFDHRGWQDGDLTVATPTLIVDLADTSGINLTGEIGHAIKVLIDPGENREQTFSLTEDFVYNRDSYTQGTAERMLTGLEPGKHSLEIWAWDNANNMARLQAGFTSVDTEGDLRLEDVLNVPNPFSDRTNIAFESVGADEVTIRIYTPSGRHIKTIGPRGTANNFNYFEWDGRDHYGDQVANGVYLYRVRISNSSGKSEEAIGKLIRVR